MSTSTPKQQDKKYWRSIEELEGSPEFLQHLQHEFGATAENYPEGVSRRSWLQLMGASLSLAGLAGCRFENVNIRPFAFRPEDRVPGDAKKYATTFSWAGASRPLLATSVDGRPIKLDGNPDHPLSLGASDVYSQGCILQLYDPDRSRGVKAKAPGVATWGGFGEYFDKISDVWGNKTGKGFCILAEPSTSPGLQTAKDAFLEKYPDTQWFEYESVSRDNERLGLKQAFGQAVLPQLDFSKAKVVLCLDADPLYLHPTAVRNTRGWTEARDADDYKMSRTYVLESRFSLTGTNADHRWPMKSRDIAGFLVALDKQIEAGKAVAGGSVYEQRLGLIAQDLLDHAGESLVVAGAGQPAEVHALVAKVNQTLKNVGSTVTYVADAFGDRPSSLEAISDVAAQIKSGAIHSMMVIGCNPAYDAPAELGFVSLLKKLKSCIHLGMYVDETATFSNWHLNLAHPLEVWGDTIAEDGSYCVAQPLIEPIFEAKSAMEVLSMLSGVKSGGMLLVQESASKHAGDVRWEQLVHDGFAKGSQPKPLDLKVKQVEVAASDDWKNPDQVGDGSFELVFTPSHSVYDGRFANNGWLQELPDPISKMTWGNVAMISPQTAAQIGVKQGNVIRLQVGSQQLDLPIYLQPGQAFGSISVALGYGRKAAGFVGGSFEKKTDPVGIDVSPVRTIAAWDIVKNLNALARGGNVVLPITQSHHAIDTLGLKEINNRWDQLIQIGDYSDLVKFRKKNGAEHVDHQPEGEHALDAAHAIESPGEEAKGKAEKSDELQGHEHVAEHGSGDGHHATWPEKPHHHKANVDLTPNNEILTAPHQWAMSIDLNKCIGCNACVVACQSENNIPVVGPEQVKRGREMQWMRIDRYLASDIAYELPTDDPEPEIETQPVTCQHCETAPCEQVCPVAATVHSSEGLNDMVYNRCIGTRYCGNNCPFKVRRFNYFNYSEAETFIKYPWEDKRGAEAGSDRSLQNMVMNPDVTIRSRGVMEKCTFCVQRIQGTKILASNEHREIGPNEIKTACQQVCPAQAIEFGDQNNKESRIAKAQKNDRHYRMLDYLNLRQRTIYLSRVKNVNEKWPKVAAKNAEV
jgi:molybdopterin-containing oxidoreductase family iron-sulfur binding subunit